MKDRVVALRAEIQRFARERRWGQFHTPKNLAMGVVIEAAELSEIFQWLTPAQSRRLSGRGKEHLEEELADVYIYLLKLADAYGVDLVDAAKRKLVKNAVKYPVAKSRGLAKKYTEL